MINLYIWGAGGHGRVVFDCAIAAGYEPEFLDDDSRHHGTRYSGRIVHPPHVGLARAAATAAHVHVAIGNSRVRAACFQTAMERGLRPATLVHPAATISPSALIGEGTLIMPGAVVNAGARIGCDSIVNTGAIVEHDCRVGDHAHLAPRCTLGGGVKVGAYALIGIGAVAVPGVTIGEGATVGAGAVVVHDVPSGITVAGVPARAVPSPPVTGLSS